MQHIVGHNVSASTALFINQLHAFMIRSRFYNVYILNGTELTESTKLTIYKTTFYWGN